MKIYLRLPRWTLAIFLAAGWSAAYAQTLTVEDDSYVRSNRPTSNFGDSSIIRVRSGSHAAFLQFDLSSLAAGDVASATLRVRAQRVIDGAGDVSIHEVLGPWDEGTLTFNNVPTFSVLPEGSAPITAADEGTYVEVDVTALAAGWYADASTNFGLTIQPPATGIAMEFNSKEGGFPAELVIELGSVEKPNFTTVELEGGDYSHPVDAMSDIDAWCDISTLPLFEHCQLQIGPGVFELTEPLILTDKVDIIGAGRSGTARTELLRTADDRAILVDSHSGHRISNLKIKNPVGGTGITELRTDPDCCGVEMFDVAVEVYGSNAETGIALTTNCHLHDVVVSVNGGMYSKAIYTESCRSDDVTVYVNAPSAVGWKDNSEPGDGESIHSNFKIEVSGADSVGIEATRMGTSWSNGTVKASSIGIRTGNNDDGWDTELTNIQVRAATGIEHVNGGLFMRGVSSNGQTALSVVLDPFWSAIVEIDRSVLIGTENGFVVDDSTVVGEITIDHSSIEGTVNSVSFTQSDVKIGSSKIAGPIDIGTGSLKCVLVYDENYDAIACAD